MSRTNQNLNQICEWDMSWIGKNQIVATGGDICQVQYSFLIYWVARSLARSKFTHWPPVLLCGFNN
jgi:hypothetical protein